MIISVKEGNELGNSFITGLCASAYKNDHAENILHFFADTVEWKWSDGSEGTGSPRVLMDILKNGWGKMSSYATHTKPFICVDTENGRIVISFQMIANANARREGVTNIVMNTATYILLVNKDKKIVRWSALWDNNNEDVDMALTKLGVDYPKVEKAPMLITRAEGEAFAARYLKAISEGFLNNNHAELCRDLIANNVSWDWSDGTKGSGTYDEVLGILSKTWGSMLVSWIPVDPIVTVDTTQRVVIISFHVVSNLTGGLADENNPVCLPHAFALHLDENHKVTKLNACWDNNDDSLQAIVSKIKAKLEVTPAKVGKVLVADTPMAGITAGQ